jgi:RNA polymerase sigma-70 factor (ECF subfamily)
VVGVVLGVLWTQPLLAEGLSLETAPPVVVKTVPVAGTPDVDPGLTDLRVTFSKPMQDRSWSWSTWGEENFPEIVGEIRYLEDQRTCVLPVRLEPGKFYATWLNSEKFRNFKDAAGRPAVPYLLTFTTAGHPTRPAGDIRTWVEAFFDHNFRDVTARDTLEWGGVVTNANGTLSIRYQYRARIWDSETVTNNQVFTFDPQGRFVSVKGVYRNPQERMTDLVGKFFANNYRDIIARETLEWGPVHTASDGNTSVRYCYRARIRDGQTVTNDQVFTFDPEDRFVSVRDAISNGAGSEALLQLLSPDQRAVIEWTDRQFRSYFDERTFDGWSDDERRTLEAKCIDALTGPRSREYYTAINTLGSLRSTNGLPRLRELAFERVDKNNRDRWMAVRVLGILGDRASVPELIHLVYHGNQNTHWWAQIALVQLTGQNFGGDWEAWGRWWTESGESPAYNPEIIRWWDGQADTVEGLKETLAEGDRTFLESLKGEKR